MLPIIKRKLVDKKWLDGDEFGDYVAVAQTAPGAIAVNLSTAIGYQLRGMKGALVAAAGMVLPSLIVITFVAIGLQEFAEIPAVHHALQGITLVVIILMADAVIDLSKSNLIDALRVVIATLAFVCVYFFAIPTTIIIGVSLIFGMIKTVVENARRNAHD